MTYKELNDFKIGARANAVMSPFTANLNYQDMLDIAAYYSCLPRLPSSNLDPKIPTAPTRNVAPAAQGRQPVAWRSVGSLHQGAAAGVRVRRNDISPYMRSIARQMMAAEI